MPSESLEIDIHAGNGATITAGGRWTPLIMAMVLLIITLLYGQTI